MPGLNVDGVVRKRKRFSTATSPLTSDEEIRRKRSNNSSDAAIQKERTKSKSSARDAPAIGMDGLAAEDVSTSARAAATASPMKGMKGKKGKQKTRRQKEVVEEMGIEQLEESAEIEEEQSEEHAAKTEAERKNFEDGNLVTCS